MLRMTLVLVAAVYAVLAIWGERPETEVAVARATTTDPTAVAMTSGETTDRAIREAGDVTAREAVEIALAAGEQPVEEGSDSGAPEQVVAEPERPIWYVTGSRVNLRDGPSTRSAIVGQARLGQEAEVLSGASGNWVRIRTSEGTEAYIFGRYLAENPV